MLERDQLSRRSFLAASAATLADGRSRLSSASDKNFDADICIYGGTSGGVVAAVQVARKGKKAVLIEPGKHLGGMTSGGLSAIDIGNPRSVGGIAREYFTRLAAQYDKQLAWDKPLVGVPTGGAFAVEPHRAEALFRDLARKAEVSVHLGQRLQTVRKDGPRITELVMEDGTVVRAKIFIDATYEGDLMAKAGVTYTLKREANARYTETLNGVQLHEVDEPKWGEIWPNGRRRDGRGVWDRSVRLDPYVLPGKPDSGLLPLVEPGELGRVGDDAPGVQAYCFRLCMTDVQANRVPVDRPPGYDAKRYELVARYIAACQALGDPLDLRWFTKYDALPNGKYDFNTAWLGSNLPGTGVEYAEAGPARRGQILKQHELHQRGLLHFLSEDSRVPAKVRDEARQFGLCKDEFTDNGGWPHQLYIREARRMVSDFVMTEHHCRGTQVARQPVALGSYGIDIHEVRRIAHEGRVVDEGKLRKHGDVRGPYPIGYGALVPRAAECENLYVSFAVSASHVAFGSIRMEPVFMVLSQSAATAACQAIDAGVSVQKVNYEALRARLLQDGQVLELSMQTPRK